MQHQHNVIKKEKSCLNLIFPLSLLLFILAAKQLFSTKNNFGHSVEELAKEAMLLVYLKQSKYNDHNHLRCWYVL